MEKTTKSPRTILKNTFWCLRLVYRANPRLFNLIIFLQLIGPISPFVRSRLFSELVDNITYKSAISGTTTVFLAFIAVLFISSVISFFQTQTSRIFDTQLQGYLRKMFIQKVSGLDYQHLEGKETANLISKVDEEFGWRTRQTVSDFSNIFTNVISLITVTVILLPKYPILWLLIFIGQIPQYLIEKYWVQKDWQLHEENSDKNMLMWDLNYQLRDKNHIAELRINNAINFLYKKFAQAFDFFTKGRVNLRLRQTPSELCLMVISTVISLVCLGTLVADTANGKITIGLFTFFFQTINQTADFFRGLVFSSVSVTENSYHIGNFRKVMELKNKINGGKEVIDLSQPPKIEFVDVSFKYPHSHRYVYRHLNLTINSGEEIAIVGANGAGKSTLIKLLCRFYDPTHGRILVNNIDLRDINLDSWYQQLSYLAQEFNSYWNLTLRDNVILGNPQIANDKLINTALSKADAKFTKKYSQGLDTFLSQRYGGEEPSWGQSQKIAIARVFYRNSPIVILDEPTASIDAVSEYKIFNQLYQEISGKTLLIVSHRFSTVRNAERIIVIDKGQIVEQGTHEELLKLKGAYAHSFNLQAKGYN